MLIYLFGLPAAGKNFVGQVLAEEFGFMFYDGDLDLTPEMRDAVRDEQPFTDEMRDRFYQMLVRRIRHLLRSAHNLAISQATFKERHRRLIAAAFPQAVFVMVEADEPVRMARLARGKNPVTVEYARRIAAFFEPPQLPHFVITNNGERDDVVRQLASLLEWFAAD